MNKIFSLTVCLMLALNAFSQTWESVRNNKDYLYGEGWGTTVAEAEEQALANLISKIATTVTSSIDSKIKSTTTNGQLDESSQFSQSINTFSTATLTNTEQMILQDEPNAYVVRWIKKSEIDRIFDARRKRVLEMVDAAMRADEKGQADAVLYNCYWALAMLKSLQYPNEVTYTDKDNKEHVLTHWLKEQMDNTFANLKVSVESVEGDDVNLLITYKGMPASSVNYTYYDGRTWSSVCSAKDGIGTMEMAPGHMETAQQIELRFDYENKTEAKVDQELVSVLTAVKGTAMPKAKVNVKLSADKAHAKQARQAAATAARETGVVPPKALEKKEYSEYMKLTERVMKAVKEKTYSTVQDCFTDNGWDMFTSLIQYGQARVLNSPDIRFYEYNGMVMERGVKMSFEFKNNARKSFVEDVVLTFDENKKICNIAFGLGRTAENDILNKGLWDEKSRIALMHFLENYKTAYALKRLDYIESVFDDDAIIITATVLNKASQSVNVENRSQLSSDGNKIIRHNRQTKDQYLRNLKRCFSRNEFVNIRFANNDVLKLGTGGESYSIQIEQDYYSSTYGDHGYLMLMVDMNDAQKPLIKVRTWQPEKDPNFGLYGPGDF